MLMGCATYFGENEQLDMSKLKIEIFFSKWPQTKKVEGNKIKFDACVKKDPSLLLAKDEEVIKSIKPIYYNIFI